MADNNVEFDFSEIERFYQKIDELADGKFKKELETWLYAIGVDFLRVVQDEIIRLEIVDTRLLLNSFQPGRRSARNVLKKLHKGLGIEAGTNVEYAQFVNDGHKTRQGKGKGKSKENGKKWVEGRHYFDIAVKKYEKILNKALDKKLQQWLDGEFKSFK